MLKAVFFDFDGTLCDDGATIDSALEAAGAAVRRRRPDIEPAVLETAYRGVSDRAWTDYDRHLRPLGSPETMLRSLWRQTLAEFDCHDADVADAAATTYWGHRLDNCRPFADVLPLLPEVSRAFHASLLTNGAPAMQRAKVRASGLATYFRDVFVGGEFAQGKPAPFIFSAALKAAGCQPNEAVYVGDSLVHDVVGARCSGLHSVWLNRRGLQRTAVLAAHTNAAQTSSVQQAEMDQFARPDFEITGLAGLPACLERIGG